MNIWSRLQQLKEDDAASRGIGAGRWYSPILTDNVESDRKIMKREDDKRRKELNDTLYSVVNVAGSNQYRR